MTEQPFLSIIIPAYNEEHRLPGTLKQVQNFMDTQSYHIEILIVENGSHDQTLAIAQTAARSDARVRAIHEDGRGKGLAVKRGMLEARGSYRFMADADLSMPIEEIKRFLPPQLEGYDVVIGSREAPGAVRYDEPLYRHLGGRAINWMIRILALPGLHDTQCGFKCFSAGAAEKLFSAQTLTGFAFDVEVLYIAKLYGYRIVEIPVPWYYNAESKVSALRDALRMLHDILMIRRNAIQGRYAPKQ